MLFIGVQMIKPGFEVDNGAGKFRGSGPYVNPSGGSSVIKRLSGLQSSPEDYLISRRPSAREIDTSKFRGMGPYEIFMAARETRDKKIALEAVAALADAKAFNWLVFLMRHCANPAAKFATDALYKRHARPMDSPDYVEMGVVAYFVKGNRKKILISRLEEAAESENPLTAAHAQEGLKRSKDGGLYFYRDDG
ncbi:MAG: hypothetical protein WC506_01175 [Candidatus Micrarchaeia archaeon]